VIRTVPRFFLRFIIHSQHDAPDRGGPRRAMLLVLSWYPRCTIYISWWEGRRERWSKTGWCSPGPSSSSSRPASLLLLLSVVRSERTGYSSEEMFVVNSQIRRPCLLVLQKLAIVEAVRRHQATPRGLLSLSLSSSLSSSSSCCGWLSFCEIAVGS
jgi:hypothetical protein